MLVLARGEAIAASRDLGAIGSRPLGQRGAAGGWSRVSSRRLCGAHSSAIASGHDHSVDASTATVANASPVAHS